VQDSGLTCWEDDVGAEEVDELDHQEDEGEESEGYRLYVAVRRPLLIDPLTLDELKKILVLVRHGEADEKIVKKLGITPREVGVLAAKIDMFKAMLDGVPPPPALT